MRTRTDPDVDPGPNVPGTLPQRRARQTTAQRGTAISAQLGLAAGYASAVIFLTLLFFGHFLLGGAEGDMAGGGGSILNQAIYVTAFALAIAAAQPWVDPRRLLVLPVGLALAIGWCWLSVTWAIAPAISFRRVAQLTVVAVTTFLLVRHLGYRRMLVLLQWSSLLALIGCYLVVFLKPDMGIQQVSVPTEADSAGSWRGVLLDKNVAGAFAATIMLFFLFDAKRIMLVLRLAIIAAIAVFLWKSQSKTSIGVLVFSIAAGSAILRYNPVYRSLLIPALMGIGVIVALCWNWLSAPFQQSLYDTSLFTGRGPIWATLLRYLHDHWLLGAGFGSFWAIGPGSPVYVYSDADWVKQIVSVGHNGYLDMWAATGLPGVILAVAAAMILPLVRVMKSKERAGGRVALAVALLVFCIGNNFTESSLLNGDEYLNVISMFALAFLYAVPDEPAPRPRPAAVPPARNPPLRQRRLIP